MANPLSLVLRALQFFWTLLVLALTANIIDDAFNGNPSVINYCIFVAVFSMLSLIYLIAISVNDSFTFHPVLPLGLEGLNTLFFLIGGIALAAKLGAHKCTNSGYTTSNGVTNGAVNTKKRCEEAQAVCTFLWFGFASYAASLFFTALNSRGGGGGLRGGIRGAPTSMSQV